MSSTALKLVTEEAHGTRWLWLDDAARLLGCNEGTLRRRCGAELHARQLARTAKRTNGQTAWQICELADPRLSAAAPAAANQDLDLSSFSDAQRAEFSRRLRLLTGWRDALAAARTLGLTDRVATERYVAQQAAAGTTIHRATLYRWSAAWAKAKGPAGLIDPRWSGAPAEADTCDDRFASTLKRLYLSQNRLSIQSCTVAACQDAGIEYSAATYKAAQRLLRAIPRETIVYHREGKAAYTDKIQTHIDRNYELIDANQVWCADHHRFDAWVSVIDPTTGELKHVRPWLHAWQDLRSRRIVGHAVFAHDPNAGVIVRVLTDAIRGCYAPAKVYLDNGKDFDSRLVTGVTKRQRRGGVKPALTAGERAAVGGVCSMLGIGVKHAWDYHGQSKPIERWFRTVADQFSKRWPTYCGNSPDTRPDDVQRKIDGGQAPTLEEFAEAFAAYVRDECNAHVHLGDGMHGQTPDQVWAERLASRVTVPADLLDFVRLTRVKVTVRQKAVVVIPGYDVRYGRGERELIDRIGQEVVIAYDPQSVGTAFLCDPDTGRALCRLSPRDRLSPDATAQDLREATAEKRRLEKRARDYHEARPRLGLDVVELSRLAAAKRAAATRQPEQALATGTHDAPLRLSDAVASLGGLPLSQAASNPLRIGPETLSAGGSDLPATPSYFSYRAAEDDQ